MLCAHTIRRLKPGSYDEFVEKFVPTAEEAPSGWVRFHVLRSLADENEVITFGFFDGTLQEMQQSQDRHGYEERRRAIDPLVEEVVLNGVYEIVDSWTPEGGA